MKIVVVISDQSPKAASVGDLVDSLGLTAADTVSVLGWHDSDEPLPVRQHLVVGPRLTLASLPVPGAVRKLVRILDKVIGRLERTPIFGRLRTKYPVPAIGLPFAVNALLSRPARTMVGAADVVLTTDHPSRVPAWLLGRRYAGPELVITPEAAADALADLRVTAAQRSLDDRS